MIGDRKDVFKISSTKAGTYEKVVIHSVLNLIHYEEC